MSGAPEPMVDMSEIVGLYKEDARRMIRDMASALGRWDEVCIGGPARNDLRRLSHQLRGSGRTYGFHSATRVSKAMEKVIQKLEKQTLQADDRVHAAIGRMIQRLGDVFKD